MITIKTLSVLFEEYKADLEAKYGSGISWATKLWITVLAAVQAAKFKLFYLSIGKVQKNIAPDTADPEAKGGTLERFGRLYLKRNPFPATVGEYTIQVTGTDAAVIPARTTFKSDDDSNSPSKLFQLDSQHIMSGTSDTITVRALEPGTDSRLLVGDGLTSTVPISGVNSEAVVTVEVTVPADKEDIEDYRSKILLAIRLEPQGGAPSDYILWSLDAQGVLKAYPYAKSGSPNEIDLFIEATEADSDDGFGTPGATILAAVEEVIEFDPDTTKTLYERGRRPMGVFDVHVLPVVVKEVNINIPGLVDATAAEQASIQADIEDLISTIRPFIAGADVLANKNDILDINRIISSILETKPGAVFSTPTMTISGSPVTTYTFNNGEIPYIGAINFT